MHKCHWYSKDHHQDGNHNGDGAYLGLSIIVNIDEIRSRDGDTDFVLVKENEALAMVVAVLKPHRWSDELHVLQFRDRYLDHGGDRSSGGRDPLAAARRATYDIRISMTDDDWNLAQERHHEHQPIDIDHHGGQDCRRDVSLHNVIDRD